MPRVIACLTIAAVGIAWSPVSTPAAYAASSDVVISQVYGGGGGSGATYNRDFVEIFNRGATAVSLTGKTVQYASATGVGNFGANPVTMLSGSLEPGGHYLVHMASGGPTGAGLPTADATGTVAMSASAGKVILVDSTSGLACNGSSTPCSPAQIALIRDLVGYGSTTTFSEGSPTGTLSTTLAALRKTNGCTETDSNAGDFAVATPDPRNTASAATVCSAPDTAPAVSSTVPDNGGTLSMGGNLTVTFSEPVTVSGSWFTLSCTTSAAVSATVTGGPSTFTLDPDSTLVAGEGCTLTVLASAVTDQDASDPPDAMAADHVTAFTVQDPCTLAFTTIGSVQGPGPSAAITGPVTTKGVVTADFEGAAAVGGFYLQDVNGDANTATSDGIFVYTGNANLVAKGQVVRVTGYARERYGQTTLNGANSDTSAITAGGVDQCGPGSVAVTDVVLPWASATVPEQYEGMLVRFPQDLVIAGTSDYDRYGELTLAAPASGEPRLLTGTEVGQPGPAALAITATNVLSTVILDDAASGQNPAALRHPDGAPFGLSHLFRAGDTVSATTGVLGFDYSAYRLYPTAAATFTVTNPRPAAPSGGAVRVASVNASNYFLTGDGAGLCGPAKTMPCRGWDADQPAEFTRQRTKLLSALATVDADIIGLTEVENTTDVEPLSDLVTDMPGWSYIDTGTIGTDAIRSGLLYRTSDVAPVGAFAVLDAGVDARFVDTANRPTLAQAFRDLTTGDVFTVAVNHFRSKGSACAGDPDLGDGQGDCNGIRTQAAQALMDWLATDPSGSGTSDVLVIGDLNSYSQEDPVRAVIAGADDTAGTGDDFTDLLGEEPAGARYSYIFDAQAGSLDHALASSSLAAHVVLAAVWHVNSDESDVLNYDTTFKPDSQEALYAPDAYGFGDHDPLIVGIDRPSISPPPDTPGPTPTVTPGPTPTGTPTVTKQSQTVPLPPRRIKRRGLTVLARSGLRTSAGQPVTSVVRGKQRKAGVRLFRVVHSKGALKVRTYGVKGVRLRLVQSAAGTETFVAFNRTIRYVNGKRRG